MVMGLFDTLTARAKCPFCGFQAEVGFQTKTLGKILETYKIGDKIETDYFVIKDVIIKNCAGICKNCGKMFYGDFSAKNGKLHSLIRVKKKEDIRATTKKLSAKTIKNIKKALDDIKQGRTHSMDEVKNKLGIK
jgi:hypothetical protein